MAGVGATAVASAVTLTASTALTVLQITAATNTRALIERFDVSFNGITPTDPGILIEVLTQTTAGTMTSVTPVKWCSTDSETLQTTASKNASAEPTAGNILWADYTNEQVTYPIIFDPPLPVPGGTRVGVRITPGTLTATTKATVAAKYTE